jgi:sulfate transport system substrate-binding protein
LAAYAYALRRNHNDDAKARDFVARLYRNVKVLDNGARASTTTFTEREMGDALITWENEAFYILRSPRGHEYQLVSPSVSILAQPPTAWVDANTAKHHTQRLAHDYLAYLYEKPAQRLACAFGYRRIDMSISCGVHFPSIDMVSIKTFGGWKKAQSRFFGEGGVFDQIYQPQ